MMEITIKAISGIVNHGVKINNAIALSTLIIAPVNLKPAKINKKRTTHNSMFNMILPLLT
jgi:hypothetical protein